MALSVYVQGREVATLAQSGDFKSVLTYHPQVASEDFVSLTMPVRSESYVWDDQLPPVLQMNLPEGYLLQVLQEQFGPHIGANPTALLSVIGRNMVGRLQVAAPGAELHEPAQAVEVAALLKGDNAQLPFVALNKHLCMQVVGRVMPAAKTEVSDDGQALVVHRFDVDEHGQAHWGMEDFCSLLGLRPAAKYDTTWERIAKAVRDHVPGAQRLETFRQLATTLLLTHALRNADGHAKNMALLYTSCADVHLAPAFDVLTTSVYAGFQHNPPAIEFMGKKTWTPGKNLQRFIAVTFGVQPKEQQQMVQAISDAVADVGPSVRQAMAQHLGFEDIGKRMLMAWAEGVQSLRDQRVYAPGHWTPPAAFDDFSPPPKQKSEPIKIGRSPLLGKR